MVGWHLKRMASGIFGAMFLSVVLVPLSAQAAVDQATPSPTGPAVSTSQAAVWHQADAEGAAVTSVAKALGPYLVRQADGTFTLNAPSQLLNRLPAKYVVELIAGLLALNKLVQAGTLQTTATGGVFDPKTETFALQGNWNGEGQDWWHTYLCLSHQNIQNLTNFGVWALTTAGLAALIYFAAAIGTAVTVVVYLYAGWMYLDDHGSGSCLNFGHWPPPNIWVTSQ